MINLFGLNSIAYTFELARNTLTIDEYILLKKSFNKMFRNMLLFIFLVIIPFMLLCLYDIMTLPLSKLILSQEKAPIGTTKTMVVDLNKNGSFFWLSHTEDGRRTIINKHSIDELDTPVDKFKNTKKVQVFINDNQDLLKVAPVANIDYANIEFFTAFILLIVVPLIAVTLYKRRLSRTCGKAYTDFYNSFCNKQSY